MARLEQVWSPGSPAGSVEKSISKVNLRFTNTLGLTNALKFDSIPCSSAALLCQWALKQANNCEANPVVLNTSVAHAINVKSVTNISQQNRVSHDESTSCLSHVRGTKPSFTYCCYMMLSYVTTTIVLHHHVSSLVDVRYCGVWCIQEHVFHCPSPYWQTVGGYWVSTYPLPTKGLSAATLTAAFSSEGAAALWTWARSTGVCVHQ